MDDKHGPFRFTEKKNGVKKMQQPNKIIPSQIKLFSPEEVVETVSSEPGGRKAGW